MACALQAESGVAPASILAAAVRVQPVDERTAARSDGGIGAPASPDD